MIAPDIRSLLKQSIKTIGQLETLLLLFEQPDRTWTAEAVAQELRTSSYGAESHLESLVTARLLVKESGADPTQYVYRALDNDLHRRVAEISTLYRERRISIIEVLYGAPQDALRAFADAFRITKEPKDG